MNDLKPFDKDKSIPRYFQEAQGKGPFREATIVKQNGADPRAVPSEELCGEGVPYQLKANAPAKRRINDHRICEILPQPSLENRVVVLKRSRYLSTILVGMHLSSRQIGFQGCSKLTALQKRCPVLWSPS